MAVIKKLDKFNKELKKIGNLKAIIVFLGSEKNARKEGS